MQEKTIRVLLIDDDPVDADLTERALSKFGATGFEVARAASLAEAESRLRDAQFDVALLDLGLPGCQRDETLGRFRVASGEKLPVVILTGLADESTALAALDRGAQDYLSKDDVTPQLLSRTIRYALQRHQLVDQIESANDELERKNQRLSQLYNTAQQFVENVSHEFRTPLTAMCHLTEILERGGARPERLSEYYRALGKESRRLHTTVENLLDFGRMDSGRRTYEFSETDAVELVDHVAHEFADRSAVAARRIEKSPLPSQGHAMIIHADREALALALRNLLDNALKYSPDSSPVRVGVKALNGTVAVSIEDQGPGVGAQERRAIFRKFTRGAAARSLNVKGTGIGLTMANQIVKAHGGRLEVESEPGRGSTFTMVLPAMPR